MLARREFIKQEQRPLEALMDEYQVRLSDYQGPLDLLLYLVKKNEIDVLNIPVAKIAAQFQEFLDVLKVIDFEMVGDFLVCAATLAEIKSRMLLPRSEMENAEEAIDPRRELVQQLLEYRRLKDAAARLEAQAAAREQRLPRLVSQSESAQPDHAPIRTVELWDLVSAFARIMQDAEAQQPDQVVADETPQHVYLEMVRDRVHAAGRLAFHDVFDRPYYRLRLISIFLAILELIRSGEITLDQNENSNSIWLVAGVRRIHGTNESPKN